MTLDLQTLDFDKGGGLVTVVAQHATTGAVLMVAFADREALERTLETGQMHFRSRRSKPSDRTRPCARWSRPWMRASAATASRPARPPPERAATRMPGTLRQRSNLPSPARTTYQRTAAMMKGGLGNLMKQAQQMQEKLQKAQAEIAAMEVEGESGAGLVRVVITGRHEARRVTIDPSLLADDKDMLEDLVAAAFNDAVRKLERTTQERMSGLTAGLPLPPGMKLPF